MIQTKYKSYPAYKKSGVEWIGEIPEHWEERKVNRTFSKISSGGTPTSGQEDYYEDGYFPWINTSELRDRVISESEFKVTKKALQEFKTLKIYPEKTLLIAMYGATIGKVGLLSFNACTNQACCAMQESNSIDNYYGFYLFLGCRNVLINYSFGGGQPNISQTLIKSFSIPLPPLPEQQAIANFLDRETARINGIVEKQTRMIELLKEKRSALITKAVTKGLDPNVKLKPSGVEWIGEIPEGWEVRKIKYCLSNSFTNGIFKKASFYGNGTKLVNVFDIYRDNYLIDYSSLDRVITEGNEKNAYSANDGDVFFVRSSLKEAGIAASACLPKPDEETVFECHLIRARPKKELLDSKYFIYQLNSILSRQRQISLSQTVTMTTISQPNLGILETLLPSLHEQQAIADFLDRETAKIDTLIEKIERQIELLNEYRQSLITSAVTGKIDVSTALNTSVRGKANAQNS